MAGNTIGQVFTVTTFGESHGEGLGCIIDSCPPGLPLTAADIQADLDRRKPGTSRHVTQRREADEVEILSGVFEGKTTGTPIALLIRNTDQRSKDYGDIARQFRPGHADYTYWHKFGTRDYRGGGRSSARETAARVAAGAVAKKWLHAYFGTEIVCWVTQVGEHEIAFEGEEFIGQNPFFAANQSQIADLERYMDSVRKSLDSVGAKLRIEARNVPVGLGEPVFDRLDADIAHALMRKAWKSATVSMWWRNGAACTATNSHRKALNPTIRAASWAAFPPGRRLPPISLSSRPAALPRRANPSISTAMRWKLPRTDGMTPVSACAPRRLQKPCWRWC